MKRPSKKYVIVGGVAGGMSAATRLRRLDENASITVIERSGYVSFANCGLPYYVGGVIEQRSSLLLQSPQSLAARFGINVKIKHEVVDIAPATQSVTVCDLTTGETSELSYDKLILAPGATPVKPPIPGIELALTLRDIEDTDRMAEATASAKTAVVIGGGFIGLEVAENLCNRGIKVTLIEAATQVIAPLDTEMAALVHSHLRNNGIELLLENTVTAISSDSVTTSTGAKIPADIVVAATGVRPDIRLAEAAGIAIGAHGGIKVDSQMRTSDPHIYAIGDAVEKSDRFSAESTLIPLANTANRQGRILADILNGMPGRDRPVLGTIIIGAFGLQIAATGWNEKRLIATKRPYRVIHTHPFQHATYYPGATALAMKLLVDTETDAILGAQVVGGDGVDKRIDIIATAIAGNLTASALADLELAYAPAFGSAKDAVNMLGYVNMNLRDKLTRSIQWYELEAAMAAGAHLIDVRTPAEFAAGAIPGAINIPVDNLRDHIKELPEGELIVHCAVGIRGHTAARILSQAGRSVRNLDGGYKTWITARDSQ